MVRAGTAVLPGSDAAVFIVREAHKILAATCDCNALYCRLNPWLGAQIAVAEAARNLACAGAAPLAVTDNLNFGNPYKPENFWQLRESVEGMAEACRFFGTPVTGVNVSLYNENPRGAIDPTPTVGMVGIIEAAAHITTQAFRHPGDAIVLLGETFDELGGSQYLRVLHGRKEGDPPKLDMDVEKRLHETVRQLIRSGDVRSAHDCSEGGLAVALAECCISGQKLMGAEVELGDSKLSWTSLLFSESQSRVILSIPAETDLEVITLALQTGVVAKRIGTVGGENLVIRFGGESKSWPVSDLRSKWYDSIAKCME
jgi:phosphoribosylformylglycinamidine synthase